METTPTLPPEIVVREEGRECVRYVLPRRDLKHGKWIAGLLLIAGAAIVLCTIWTLYAIIASFFGVLGLRKGGFGAVAFLFTVFSAPMTWGGATPLWWGLVSLLGHREVEVKGKFLRTIERCGPFWRSKRWSIDKIQSLQIRPLATNDKGEAPPPIDLAGEFNALLVHPLGKRQGMVAWGYPVAMLVALAQAIVARCNQALEVQSFSEAAAEERDPIYVYGAGVDGAAAKSKSAATRFGKRPSAMALAQVDDADVDDADVDDEELEDEELEDEEAEWTEEELQTPPIRPTYSRIAFEQLDGGDFTVTIPPAGVWKGSKGLFPFGLIWCGALGLITTVIVVIHFNEKEVKSIPILAPLLFSVFWLAGIGMLLGGINMGRRRSAIARVGDHLMAIQTGIFGSKKQEWSIAEVKAVRVGPSGMEINNRPILELQILDIHDKKFGFLAERDDEELRWLAWEIKEVLPKAAV